MPEPEIDDDEAYWLELSQDCQPIVFHYRLVVHSLRTGGAGLAESERLFLQAAKLLRGQPARSRCCRSRLANPLTRSTASAVGLSLISACFHSPLKPFNNDQTITGRADISDRLQ